MNIKEALHQGTMTLTEAGSESPRLDAQVLLLAVLNAERTILIAHPERELASQEEQLYDQYISERALGKPVSYITGRREFMGLEFAVNEAVLIPRPETEVLVEEALREIEDGRWEMGDRSPAGLHSMKTPGVSSRGNARPRVLDLCTGSGAIAVSIKHFAPEAEVIATDLSEEALEVARENARRILGGGRWEMEDGRMGDGPNGVRFLQGDLFEALNDNDPCHSEGEARRIFSNLQSPISDLFDLIVSNPPYIPKPDIEGLMRDVKDFEPRMALDGGEDGLDIYRRLIPEAAKRLAPGGVLILEIGSDQGEIVPELCRQAGLTEVRVLKDLAGLDRVVRAKRRDEK